jgi:hypothetical protein
MAVSKYDPYKKSKKTEELRKQNLKKSKRMDDKTCP